MISIPICNAVILLCRRVVWCAMVASLAVTLSPILLMTFAFGAVGWFVKGPSDHEFSHIPEFAAWMLTGGGEFPWPTAPSPAAKETP